MTIDAACEAVEKEAPVGFERVREIYLARRHDLAVRAEFGLRLLFPAKGDKSAWAAAVMAREGRSRLAPRSLFRFRMRSPGES
jgi:hypothetical protein